MKKARRRLILEMVLALAIYLALAVVVTWPLGRQMRTHFAGSSKDALLHFWNGWQAAEALKAGESPYYTDMLFYPAGVSLVYHNIGWTNIAEWLVLRPVMDDQVAHNLVILFNLGTCGAAMYLLVFKLTDHRPAAFFAGIVYLSWPFRMSQLDHPNLISTQWIPLFILFLVLVIRHGRRLYGALAGLALGLVGYTRWQLLIPAAVGASAFLVGTLPTWLRQRRSWLGLLVAMLVAGVLLAPPAALLFNELETTPATSDTFLREGEESIMQVDLLAYLTPPDDHPVLGRWTEAAYSRYYGDRSPTRRYTAYIGLTVLLLAVVGIWRNRRESRPWILMALLFILLAMGETLRINGRQYGQVPTLYRILQPLYIVRLIRVPDRFNLFLALPLAVLAGYGFRSVYWQISQRPGRVPAYLLLPLAAGATLFEYWCAPVPLQTVPESPFFHMVKDDPDEGALLNLPIDPAQSKTYMYQQTVHGRPIMQGHVSREPPGAYAYIDAHPWLRVLRQIDEMDPWLTDVSRQLTSLADDNVTVLVLHKTAARARIAHWRRYLPTRPYFEDEILLAYRTRLQAGRDFDLLTELAPGVGPTQMPFLSTSCQRAGEVIELDVSWGTTQPVQQALAAQITLVAGGGQTVQSTRFPVAHDWPTEDWPADTVVWGYYPFHLDPTVAAGEYDLTLALVDGGSGEAAGATMTAGRLAVAETSCPTILPPGAVAMDARFGGHLRLHGYQLERLDGMLQLTLYWQAEQRMQTDYKVFVHVFEPSTGIPVAQDDSMPHRGGYPTRFWWPGEVVEDRIPVSLDAAAPGFYGLAVGVYDPVTMERIPVTDNTGQLMADGRLILPDEQVRIRGE
jgi:hypothetical protein